MRRRLFLCLTLLTLTASACAVSLDDVAPTSLSSPPSTTPTVEIAEPAPVELLTSNVPVVAAQDETPTDGDVVLWFWAPW